MTRTACQQEKPRGVGTVLLISNRVMHYRVSVYNYLHQQFDKRGSEFHVLTNELQAENQVPVHFPLEVMPFEFRRYTRRITEIKPGVVILFLHLKDKIIWPLFHWLKWRGIPVVFWTKTRNLDDPHNRLRNLAFDYLLRFHDALILYTDRLMVNVPKSARSRAFAANNTVNFRDYPVIAESKEELRSQLNLPFKKVVLFVGRMGVEGGRKRADHLIDIFRDLKHPEYGLVIVGSGMPEDWKSRMNPCNTRYLGEIHDPEHRQISKVFKMADLCCIPGHVGLGLNQAFFWGLPVVTEEGLQPPEICYLRPGRNGFIVKESDIAALKEKTLLLLEDDALRAELSRNAREDILREASIEGMFDGFWKAVECAVGGGVRAWHES